MRFGKSRLPHREKKAIDPPIHPLHQIQLELPRSPKSFGSIIDSTISSSTITSTAIPQSRRRMSQVEIIRTRHNLIDFDVSRSAPSYHHIHQHQRPDVYPHQLHREIGLSWSATSALVNDILASSRPLRLTAEPTLPDFPLPSSDDDRENLFPSLPPLLHGHPEVHLRSGIMNASHLAALNEADAEKAFFVADLGQVYRQHQRWVACLPEIQPFYGTFLLFHAPSIFVHMHHRSSS